MNAAEQATSPEVTGKIAAMINLVKQKFPKAKANLTPWTNDPDTREWVDPSSIDVGFNLPAGHTLMQLRFHEGRLVGIEALCFGPFGNQRWKFSTIGDWSFQGSTLPPPGFRQTLKQICQDLFLLFNHPPMAPDSTPE